MRVWGMRPGIIVDVTAADRARLEAVVADRNSPQKHVWRAAIVLATADGLGTAFRRPKRCWMCKRPGRQLRIRPTSKLSSCC